MKTVTPEIRRIILPNANDAPAWRGAADIRIEGHVLNVTIDLPSFAMADLRWEVHASELTIHSRNPSAGLHLSIPFTHTVRTGFFIVRGTRGVYDVWMELE